MSPRELLTQARESFDAGHIDESSHVVEYLLGSFPDYYEARLLRGLSFERSANAAEAADEAAFVLDVDPANATALLLSARLARNRGDDEHSRLLWLRVAEIDPAHPDLRSATDGFDHSATITAATLGYSYMRHGWPELAERQFGAAVESNSGRIDLRLGLAEAVWSAGHFEESRHHCRTVLDHHPNCLKALLIMAHVLTEVGRTNHGAELLEKAAQLDPDYWLARQMYGRLEFDRVRVPGPPVVAPPPVEPAPEAAADQVEEPPASAPEKSIPASEIETADEPDVSSAAEVLYPSESEDTAIGLDQVAPDSETAPSSPDVPEPVILDVEPDADAADRAGADNPKAEAGPASEVERATAHARAGDWVRAIKLITMYSRGGEIEAWEAALTEICDMDSAPHEAWEALGDLYMRMSRPQNASEAYGRAIEARSGGGGDQGR